MVVGVNCGHTISGPGSGAIKILNEAVHARLVGYTLMEKLEKAGMKVVDCTIDEAQSRQKYLQEAVKLANKEELDWFISIHFNASYSGEGNGTEIYTYKGRQYPEALAICAGLEKLGFANRGVKQGTGLYVVQRTKAKALLIEVCFCDNEEDVEIYNHIGAQEAVAQVIMDSLSQAREDSFEEIVGDIAKRDWEQRQIMLPSVVVAQAIKESGRGTSELARQANALFGIKQNGWQGKTYQKSATEQKKDGSFYRVENTLWRAYDNWEQSILDHNDYIATRSTDGGKSLRYAPVIGCCHYVLACQYLQECGYATDIHYAESLIRDYIEKYKLTRFDT